MGETRDMYFLRVRKGRHFTFFGFCPLALLIGKGKAVPLQAWTRPRGFQEVNVPRFRDNGTGWW